MSQDHQNERTIKKVLSQDHLDTFRTDTRRGYESNGNEDYD